MPKSFTDCVAKGGKVRTINIGKDKFKRVCILGGKSYAGETKTRKASTPKVNKFRDALKGSVK